MKFEEVFKVLDADIFAKLQRHLKDVEKFVLEGAWQGQTYDEISAASNYRYTSSYLKKGVGPRLWRLVSEVLGEEICKTNFRAALERRAQFRETLQSPAWNLKLCEELEESAINNHQDWGAAINVSMFYGRREELAQLEQWIVQDRCRLVALLGIGGIGKTTLSIKLAKQIQDRFEYSIWRSLRHAPPMDELLAELIQFLSQQQAINLPKTGEGKISRLIHYLRSSRSLLVLDRVETILHSGKCVGHYREGYEEYGEFFRQVGEISHQSCLLLTGRESPREIAQLAGEREPVRCLQLVGLEESEAQKILQRMGCLPGSTEAWRAIAQHYAGNPLALKVVAAGIRNLFNCNVCKFLEFVKQGGCIFDEIWHLLEQQFDRLSDLEIEVMYWLAINREPMTISELQEDIVSPKAKSHLIDTLSSLEWRSLIEKVVSGQIEPSPTRFTQQPVVMEYLTQRIIERVCEEITTTKVELLRSHSLLKAPAKNHIRESQVRSILAPIVKRLSIAFSRETLESLLRRILLKLQQEFSTSPGYGNGNVINLLYQLKFDLTSYDFSHLTIWQAYIGNTNLHQDNFTHSEPAKSVFAETVKAALAVASSPNGELLAAGNANGTIHLWQIADGKLLSTLSSHAGGVYAIAFSPDGHTLASSGDDNLVKLWNVCSGQCLMTWQGHAHRVRSVTFSPDGRWLASSSGDCTVKLWDASAGRCCQILQGDDDWVYAVTFSPDGQMLASGSGDCMVKLWDVSICQCRQTLHKHTS
ncbi:hypothetical protein C7B80_13000 [Cyanosarcina cf. burmensis CCALA 770]|nr:hypothetical protein C7B80_13000 [Cyanosarcina cf. burmensis CCALA 770]